MNERIEQILKESTDNILGVPIVDQKKFAELIVRECLQQCEQVRDEAYTQKKSEFLTESGRLIYEGVFGGANNCGYAIQQHFGVEEPVPKLGPGVNYRPTYPDQE